jgi:two-component system nitrate/nitrite sensor histidine kinase NarX
VTDLRPYLEVYQDISGEIAALQIIDNADTLPFTPLDTETLSGGFMPSTNWLRLQLVGSPDAETHWMLDVGKTNLSEVDYYLLGPEGALLDQRATGLLRPFATRAVPHEGFVFPIDLPPGAERTVLLRIANEVPSAASVSLYTPAALVARTSTRQMVLGAVFGALLIMAGYHLLLFFTLRQRSYLLLALYSVTVLTTYLVGGGHGQRYLWPNHPEVFLWMLPLSVAMAGVTLLLLTIELLETRQRAPRLHWMLVALTAAIAATLPFVPFLSLGTIIAVQYALLAPTLLLVPLAALIIWRQGYTPARYFVLAQAIPLALGLVTIVAPLVGVPLPPGFREYSIPGNVLMVLFTSFALADRINLIQAEKEQALRDLNASERRMAQYLEAIPVGVTVYKPDLQLVYANRTALDLAGNPGSPRYGSLTDALRTYSFFITGTKDPYPKEHLPLLRALRGEPSSVDDMELATPSRRFPVAMWASPVFDTSGAVEYAVTAFQDISAIRQAEQALTEAQALYRRIVEDQPALIFRFRPDGTITFANSAVTDFFGYSASEVLGNNLFNYAIAGKEESDRAALTTFTPESPVLTTEYEIADAQGNLHWVQWTVRAIYDEQEILNEFQVLGLDVTTIREAERELSEYRNHLENLVAARTEALSLANSDLQRRAEELAALNAITQSLTLATDVQAPLREVASVIQRLFRALTTSISLINDRHNARGLLAWAAAPGYKGLHPLGDAQRQEHDPVRDALRRSKQSFIIDNPLNNPLYDEQARAQLADAGIQSILCVPLLARGAVLGSIVLTTGEPGRRFGQAEMELAETIAGPLAAAFDTSLVLRREQHQRAMAESLQQVAQSLNSSLELDIVLGEVLAQLAHVLPFDNAEVFLGDSSGLAVAATSRTTQPVAAAVYEAERRAVRVFAERSPLLLTQSEEAGTVPDNTGSWMGAPLMVGSEAIGVLAIASSDAHAYRAEDAQLLQAFANQAAIAVLNARLFQQTQSVAVSKERERLARELHDAVTQTLFSASILAEALPSQWEQDPDGAQMTLGKLRQLTRGALAEMRTLLLELRPGALTEVGLDSLLRHLGEAMTGSTLVPVFLESTAVDLYLPTDVQLAFYRIAQEALNNITKHADATSVEIMLQGDASDVTLWISDDGKGFDTQAQAPGHLGLTIMHERAQAVGAQITIESTRGQGTRLGLHWSSAGPPDDVRTEAVFQHVMKE